MSLPRYPAYKDSGVAWLGEVPGHWDVKPIKAVASCNDAVLEESTPDDYEIEYVEISGVESGYGITSSEIMPFGKAPSRARRRVEDGDVLVSTVRTYLRAIAPVINPPSNLIASTGFAVVRPRMVIPHYLGYIFQAEYLISEVIARSVGVSYPAINASELMRLNAPIPSEREQQTIAAFLDRETGKIDALIAEQRRLVELLAEKRQAVISHAVTKGLNPDAQMKDSGIEWLGEVPEHWEVSRIKYHCSINGRIGFRGYTTADQVNEGNGALVLGATHINSLGEINLDEPVYLSWGKYYESPEIMVTPTNILVVQRGSTCGKVGLVVADHGPSTINPSLVLLKDFDCSSRLIFFYLSSTLVQGLFECVLGSTAIPMLSQEQIGQIAFCLPPPEEQDKIVTYVEVETAKIGELTAEANRAIALLQERRSALISAAVTGKIDVRRNIEPG